MGGGTSRRDSRPTPRAQIRYSPTWARHRAGAEVKGYLDTQGMKRLYALACGMTVCGSGNDMVVFGDVPRPRSVLWPVQLHYHDGLWAFAWKPEEDGPMAPAASPR